MFDEELTELIKRIDWALTISMALVSALLLNRSAKPTGVSLSEKLFLGALLVSIFSGLLAKLWPIRYRFSKPTDTPVRSRLAQMRSPLLKDGPFEELTFEARTGAAFEVSVNLNLALKLGKKVPKKMLKGADESVESLKSFLNRLWLKRVLHWVQLGFTFLAIVTFSIWLLVE